MEMRDLGQRALAVSAVAALFTWLLRFSVNGEVQFGLSDVATLLGLWLGVALREVARFCR